MKYASILLKIRDLIYRTPQKSYAKSYFWRSKTKQEIDYIEEIDGKLSAVEMKWNPNRKAALPLSFAKSYGDVDFKVVTQDNYEGFLL